MKFMKSKIVMAKRHFCIYKKMKKNKSNVKEE